MFKVALLVGVILFSGCEKDLLEECNVQECKNGIMVFNACRNTGNTVLLDENKDTIKCKKEGVLSAN